MRTLVKEPLVRGLSRSERLLVVLGYYEEMAMREIAAVLERSESRICQMHQSILPRLRATLNPADYADGSREAARAISSRMSPARVVGSAVASLCSTCSHR